MMAKARPPALPRSGRSVVSRTRGGGPGWLASCSTTALPKAFHRVSVRRRPASVASPQSRSRPRSRRAWHCGRCRPTPMWPRPPSSWPPGGPGLCLRKYRVKSHQDSSSRGAPVTAEVAILNREAVAIAADSAVTLTGPEGRKIYNTANKLFALSTTEPIAVMIYNMVSFGPIPWETVVKEYRRKLSIKSYATVDEYAADFIEYLSELVEYIPVVEQNIRVTMIARWELSQIRVSVLNVVREANSNGRNFNDDEISSLTISCIEARIGELRSGVFVEGLNASMAGRLVNAVPGGWDTFVDQSLSGFPMNGKIRSLARVMVRTSLRVVSQSPWFSGIVVAGFGRDQWFPALSQHLVDGVISGRVRTCQLDSVEIDEQQSAVIYPFAQRDMITTFMEGIHPVYNALEGFIEERIRLIKEYLSSHAKDALSPEAYTAMLDEMDREVSNTVIDFVELRDDLKNGNYGPIMSVVESLPKKELAEMAEALVNLTSFKLRVSLGAETVGGPVDVAVISKGDGLVWIKRKHYFSPELNHRYFSRDQKFDNISIREEQPCLD